MHLSFPTLVDSAIKTVSQSKPPIKYECTFGKVRLVVYLIDGFDA